MKFMPTHHAVVPAGVAFAAVLAAPIALAFEKQTVTKPTVVVEEFTAEWCGPCVGGYYAMERAKDRWGDEISQLTYSTADRYTNTHGSKRDNECGIFAIPTFVFHGTYVSLGTPSDSTIDTYIGNCQAQTPEGQIIGNWSVQAISNTAFANIKFQADTTLPDGYELRVILHESRWSLSASNGLTEYQYHVIDGVYRDLPAMQAGDQVTVLTSFDLSANQWVQDTDNLGITVYLHNTASSDKKNVKAGWELGPVSFLDLNSDLKINKTDSNLFRRTLGSRIGDPNYTAAADMDQNGVIDLTDRDLALDYINNGGMR